MTYLIFAAASMRLALRAREVQVPDFTNRTANEATAMAGDLGLALRVDDTRRPDPKIGAGRVLAQEILPAVALGVAPPGLTEPNTLHTKK